MISGDGQAIAAPPSNYCTACGRMLDARADSCPGCGVGQPIRAGVPGTASMAARRTRSGRSGAATALALVGALAGSAGYLWVVTSDYGPSLPAYYWGEAAAWGLPVVLLALLYASRAVSAQLGAGLLFGFGAQAILIVLPDALPGGSLRVNATLGIYVTSRAIVLIAGLVAAYMARSVSTARAQGASLGVPADPSDSTLGQADTKMVADQP